MSHHLSKHDLDGYIHQALTDEQRETLDQHLDDCLECRGRVKEAERLRRDIAYGLSSELRQTKPPASMHFSAVREGLNRRRRWSIWRARSQTALSLVGTAAILLILILGVNSLIQTIPKNETVAVASLLETAWDDPMPYQNGLISSQQGALAELTTAPVYYLDLVVADDLMEVNGRQQLRYVNDTSEQLETLLFHLYANSAADLLSVSEVTVNGRTARYKLLDEGANLQVTLREPLAPGETAVVDMAFTLETKPVDEILHLSRFHPVLAVYDGGWDTAVPIHQLNNSRNNNFYQVRLNLPPTLDLLASGSTTERRLVSEDGNVRQLITLAAGPIDQFYLSASSQFDVAVSETVGETKINSYASSARLTDMARKNLKYAAALVAQYNEQFGPYPYTELDIVNVPSLDFARQGAAFSGVVVLGLAPFTTSSQSPEPLLVNLVSSQWFDPILAQSRLTSPWLAAGLSEYATRYYYGAYYGDVTWQRVQSRWQIRARTGESGFAQTAVAYDEVTYFNTMYGRVPLFLLQLENKIGQDQFAALLRKYYQRYRWRGADEAAFQSLAEQYCACDLDFYFDDEFIRQDILVQKSPTAVYASQVR